MKSLQENKFWISYFTYRNRKISKNLFERLTKDFKYKTEKIIYEYEKELKEYNSNRLCIDLKLNNYFSLSIEIEIEENSLEFENEYLYLYFNNEKYELGLIDSNFNGYPNVFSIDEFYTLLNYIKSHTVNYEYYFLLLSKYIVLITEEESIQVFTDCITNYSKILKQNFSKDFQINKIEPYGYFKFKTIQSINVSMYFNINEAIYWKSINGFTKLEGKVTGTIRSEFNKKVENFPYELWNKMMKSIKTVGNNV